MSYPIENEKVTNVRIDGLNKRGGGGGIVCQRFHKD